MRHSLTLPCYLENWRQIEVLQFAQDSCIPATVQWALIFLGLASGQFEDVPDSFFIMTGMTPTISKPILKVPKEEYDFYIGMKRGPTKKADYDEDLGGAVQFLQVKFGKAISSQVRTDFPKNKQGGIAKAIAIVEAICKKAVVVVSLSPKARNINEDESAHMRVAIGVDPPNFFFYDVGRPHANQPVAIPINDIIEHHYKSKPEWGEDILIIERRSGCILLN